MLSDLQKRCIDITYKKKLTHLGGVLNSVDVIDRIYEIKEKEEPFILSCGHVGLALYVVLEKRFGYDAEELFEKHGTHPGRDIEHGIWCSTGSLGHGMTVGLGMALSDRKRNVYVVTSDGEMMEGSMWEALRIAAEQRLENLRITCIANGYSAYSKIDTDWLDLRMQYFYPSFVVKKNVFDLPDWIQGVDGHYVKLDEQKYKEIYGL